MKINNILNIKQSKIRIFPFQTTDPAFILYADLPSSYLLTLLIDKLGFNLYQFRLEYVYGTKNFSKYFFNNLNNFEEDYFIFYLENYYHSSNYALNFIERVLYKISLLKNRPYIFIHTLKTGNDKILELMDKYDFILVVITGDLEEFFYELFYNKKNIKDIGNIIYRDDFNNIIVNNNLKIESDLNNYILPAYSSKYYSFFGKSKDFIISILENDDKNTDKNIYYKRPKSRKIGMFRYSSNIEIMLSTGRGCKYNCSYCFRGVKYSNVRQISLDTIKKDLDYLQELKYEYIYLYDDCFITTNLDRLDEIIDLFSKYDFEYGIATRFEVCTSENLLKLSKLKIKRIQIGLQSVSIEVNHNTKRGFNKKDFENTLNNLENLGISVSLDLILGLPGEGLKGFINTFNYAVSLNPKSIFINTLFLNPGTELYKNKEKYGIIDSGDFFGRKKDFYVENIISSNSFSEKDILFCKKYVGYYMNKIKNIKIILR